MFAETCASWLRSISHCCVPLAVRPGEKSRQNFDNPFVVLHDQPGLVPPPSAEAVWGNSGAGYGEEPSRKRTRSSSNGTFSGRRRLRSRSSTSRRPQISAPSNFRHIYSESFQFPAPEPQTQARQRHRSFRPLELSIYLPDNHLSPILPHFEPPAGSGLSPPPPAHTSHERWDDTSVTLTHERSYSSMSFHLPRRPLPEDSPLSFHTPEVTPPRIPPRARTRAYTSPSVEGMLERIASAMIEKDILQAEIDSIVERQSIYSNSRPTTAYGMDDLEPMPSIPALPAAAPSFAERLSVDSRPNTAPSQNAYARMSEEALVTPTQATFNAPQKAFGDARMMDRPLAPPLPLVLRPPLRKKKSFSRVSNWLSLGSATTDQHHERDISLESITSIPRPVTDRDGFYQVPPLDVVERTSVDTVSLTSSWSTEDDDDVIEEEDEDEDEDNTVPTAWSPSSTTKQDLTPTRPPVSRMPTFGGSKGGPRPQSVGVAF